MKIKSKKPNIKIDLQDLMLYRAHEILLVASPYDAFVLEEDGRLTEQIINEYLAMNFYESPRLWRVETGKNALKLIKKQDFDVIILMMRLDDMDFMHLCSKIRESYPDKPIILLVFDMYEVERIPSDILYSNIDKVFVWKGNSNVFPAIMKSIEDSKNAYRDIKNGGVRTIIFIEDNPQYYSMTLPLLYKEIMFHTKNLISSSLDATNRLLHLRGRTKILLANTYEQAEEFFSLYRDNTLGIISDVRFPKNGKIDKSAGLKFSKYIREHEPYMPVIIQSSNLEYSKKVQNINADFLYKHSKTLLKDLRKFMLEHFGFGDFIFRDTNGNEISKSNSIKSLVENLRTIPEQSLIFHSKYNHFSNWLANRGEFNIASKLRPVNIEDFSNTEYLRKYLIRSINSALKREKDKDIIDFSTNEIEKNTPFLRIGKGSLGGKARGLLFMQRTIANSNINDNYPDVNIRIPKTLVIGTNEFEKFINENGLLEQSINLNSNLDIINLFLSKSLSTELVKSLSNFLENIDFPIAVRSSSLLEDSQFQPLAGLYSTFMLPNSSDNLKERVDQLCEAIIRIYSSTYFNEPKSLVLNTSHSIEEEKMAIIIMEIVGQKFNNRYYPTVSGITRNINYYPISYMDREEGVANIALGFGKTVVEGENSLRFSPKYPNILPQYFSVKETIKTSQKTFYALKLDHNSQLLKYGELSNLVKYGLEVAENDGQLFWAASVVSIDDNIIREGLHYPGTRVITFSNILKWNQFPLTDILIDLLKIGRSALGNPIEIEFAIKLNKKNNIRNFYILQIRPMFHAGIHEISDQSQFNNDDIICKSSVSLGNGKINNIYDIIFVDQLNFDISKTNIITKEIEKLNNKLGKNRPYLLIGPGRWGTADEWLGIPIDWNQISNVAAIVEVGLEDLPIDPSFGTHFFQNITGLRIGYFTVSHKNKLETINNNLIRNLPVENEYIYTKLLHVDKPLIISLNGTTGEGVIALSPEDIMDEEYSSGI